MTKSDVLDKTRFVNGLGYFGCKFTENFVMGANGGVEVFQDPFFWDIVSTKHYYELRWGFYTAYNFNSMYCEKVMVVFDCDKFVEAINAKLNPICVYEQWDKFVIKVLFSLPFSQMPVKFGFSMRNIYSKEWKLNGFVTLDLNQQWKKCDFGFLCGGEFLPTFIKGNDQKIQEKSDACVAACPYHRAQQIGARFVTSKLAMPARISEVELVLRVGNSNCASWGSYINGLIRVDGCDGWTIDPTKRQTILDSFGYLWYNENFFNTIKCNQHITWDINVIDINMGLLEDVSLENLKNKTNDTSIKTEIDGLKNLGINFDTQATRKENLEKFIESVTKLFSIIDRIDNEKNKKK